MRGGALRTRCAMSKIHSIAEGKLTNFRDGSRHGADGKNLRTICFALFRIPSNRPRNLFACPRRSRGGSSRPRARGSGLPGSGQSLPRPQGRYRNPTARPRPPAPAPLLSAIADTRPEAVGLDQRIEKSNLDLIIFLRHRDHYAEMARYRAALLRPPNIRASRSRQIGGEF